MRIASLIHFPRGCRLHFDQTYTSTTKYNELSAGTTNQSQYIEKKATC